MLTHKNLFLVSLLCACAAQPVLGPPTSCYVDSGAAQPVTMASMGTTMPAGNMVCVRYCFTCTAGDQACTTAQISSSAVLPAYTFVDSATASQMAAVPALYVNMYSCATTDCNTYVANSCAAGVGGGVQGAAAPSVGSHNVLHVAGMLLAAILAVALH